MNNIFYDIEDNCYRTYPDGDRANNKEIHKSIQKLQKENQQLKEHLHQKEDIINKVIKGIENDYYSMNTIDIDSIVITNNKLLLIRRFLKGDE